MAAVEIASRDSGNNSEGDDGGGRTSGAATMSLAAADSEDPQTVANSVTGPATLSVMSTAMVGSHRKRSRKSRFSSRVQTERYLLINEVVNDDTDCNGDDTDIDPSEKGFFRISIAMIVLLAMWIAGIAFGIILNFWSLIVYSCLFGLVGALMLVLDHFNQFHKFQHGFETIFNGRGQTVFLLSFCVLAFIDYILIGLSENYGALDRGAWFYIIEILYWICICLFFCCFMSFWKPFAFHCSEKSWIHALFYLSIIGYFILAVSRWLRPPTHGPNWHTSHNLRKILSSLTSLLLLLFIFCVVLGGIAICSFAEFVDFTSNYGAGVSIGLFCIVSMIIMLTPLAPGSVVDAAGGFVFIIVFAPREWYFWAWCLANAVVILLHFCGACAQWWIGTWRCVQIWGNSNLPVEMLAASDAVLRKANWFEVGLVGYIFMDTANGLNQGRINMEFWTQLFSEWPAFPNAFALVSFGAAIALPGVDSPNRYDWTPQVVPLLIIFASVVQAIGVTFGTNAMGSSVDTKTYWAAREKWEMMHIFRERGYTPTKDGWKNDIFNLASSDKSISPTFKSILFEKIAPIHKKYIEARDSTRSQQERIELWKEYQADLIEAREAHYLSNFDDLVKRAVDIEWLVYEEPSERRPSYFSVAGEDEETGEPSGDGPSEDMPRWKLRLWVILVSILTITFWVSFYFIYWATDLAEAISRGVGVLKDVPLVGWIAAGVFMAVMAFINHREILNSIESGSDTFKWLFGGCKIHPDIETRFETPEWDLPEKWVPAKTASSASATKKGMKTQIAPIQSEEDIR